MTHIIENIAAIWFCQPLQNIQELLNTCAEDLMEWNRLLCIKKGIEIQQAGMVSIHSVIYNCA